ncbi:MAG: hypothetical protein WCE54_24170 [Ignavibacteriaceae bacterium]
MDDFRRKYYRLKFLFVELVSKIDNLTDENTFFAELKSIKTGISEIQAIKNDLLTGPGKEEFKKMEPELNNFAKQIQEKFDNIIEKKRNDLAEIALKIGNLQNSRKLANYNR